MTYQVNLEGIQTSIFLHNICFDSIRIGRVNTDLNHYLIRMGQIDSYALTKFEIEQISYQGITFRLML